MYNQERRSSSLPDPVHGLAKTIQQEGLPSAQIRIVLSLMLVSFAKVWREVEVCPLACAWTARMASCWHRLQLHDDRAPLDGSTFSSTKFAAENSISSNIIYSRTDADTATVLASRFLQVTPSCWCHNPDTLRLKATHCNLNLNATLQLFEGIGYCRWQMQEVNGFSGVQRLTAWSWVGAWMRARHLHP